EQEDGEEVAIQTLSTLDHHRECTMNSSMAKRQRKTSSSNISALNYFAPGKSANVLQSSSKKQSENKNKTPSWIGDNRFIPIRNSKQMDMARFLLTKRNDPVDMNNTALSVFLKEKQKILHFGGKPLNTPAGTLNMGRDQDTFTIMTRGGRPSHLHAHPSLKGEARRGNDNLAYVGSISYHSLSCSLHSNILASEGSTSDCHIHILNMNSGSCISSLDTQSQVTAHFETLELFSTHGYTHNNVIILNFFFQATVTEGLLTPHPNCSTIMTFIRDKTIRLWNSFKVDPVKRKAKEKMGKSTNSIIYESIR
uniref:Uncharacterized protein n=1 Tax=Mola mola TaxID=94237 RepID=A0A3Q3X550_MOLML